MLNSLLITPNSKTVCTLLYTLLFSVVVQLCVTLAWILSVVLYPSTLAKTVEHTVIHPCNIYGDKSITLKLQLILEGNSTFMHENNKYIVTV